MRLDPARRTTIVVLIGLTQTLGFASTYYIPAVLAEPMAKDLGLSSIWVFTAFSAAMITSALIGPVAGRHVDRLGGRGLLIASNLLFALGLLVLAMMSNAVMLVLGWLIIGVGMGIGLYEIAFAALVAIYGKEARAAVTGVTLIAGFASTIGWPLSAWMGAEFGWRWACAGWAGVQLLLALPMHLVLPSGVHNMMSEPVPAPLRQTTSPRFAMVLLAYVFGVTMFISTSLSSHFPRILEAAGTTTAVAIAAGALMGPAQVVARLVDFTFSRKLHPLISGRIAAAGHPVAALALMVVGPPAAFVFSVLHGAGNGLMTIVKGTLPLALFGPGGYGHRQGLLSAPGRVAQALSPVIFGLVLERYGANAIWLTIGLSLSAWLALMWLKRNPEA
jgi:predicted MFS family arabinose efflux permease